MRRLTLLTVVLAAACGLVNVPSTSAATYRVYNCWPSGSSPSWTSGPNDPPQIFLAGSCSPNPQRGIYAASGAGPSPSPGGYPGFVQEPSGSWGQVRFKAPSGARIKKVEGEAWLRQREHWRAGIVGDSGQWILGGPGGVGYHEVGPWGYVGIPLDSAEIALAAECRPPGGMPICYGHAPDDLEAGGIWLRHITITLEDSWAPSARITAGSLENGTWLRGSGDLTVLAEDNTGIARIRAFIDGQPGPGKGLGCDYQRAVPCPSGAQSLSIDAGGLADGSHALTVEVADASGNLTHTSGSLGLDRSAPGPPRRLNVEGGEGWHSANAFKLAWRNPPQLDRAPIVAAGYRICPVGSHGQGRGCVTGDARGADLTEIRDVKVPRPGAWEASVWLRDAAGNENPETAPEPVVLRWDDTEPTAVILPLNPDDPTRVRVQAADDLSGVAAGELLVRRKRAKAWWPIRVSMEPGGFSGVLDDERLRRGTYDLRARAVDAAGRERSTDRLPNGRAATVDIPLRIITRLRAGKTGRIRVRGKRRTIYGRRPVIRDGRRVRLRGRLTAPGGNPLAGAPVNVYVRRGLRGSQWRPAAELRTSRTGRFSYLSSAGPSRTVRFRYPGAAKVRPATEDVHVRVRARSTIAVSRRRVVNGEAVRSAAGSLAGHCRRAASGSSCRS